MLSTPSSSSEMPLSPMQRWEQACSTLGQKGWKVIKHPLTKELAIFGFYISLLIAGAVMAGVASNAMAPVALTNLAGHQIWVIQTVSMGVRVKMTVLMIVGGAAGGIGTFGLILRSYGKILSLKEKVDNLVNKREESQAREAATKRKDKVITWILVGVQKGLHLANRFDKLLEHRMFTIMKICFVVGMVIVGSGLLYLCVHYFMGLSQLGTGVLAGNSVTGLVVSEALSKAALFGMSRSGGMVAGPLFGVSKQIVKVAYQKLRANPETPIESL